MTITVNELSLQAINAALLRLQRTIQTNENNFDNNVARAQAKVTINSQTSIQKYDDSVLRSLISDLQRDYKNLKEKIENNATAITQLMVMLENTTFDYDPDSNELTFSIGDSLQTVLLKDTTYTFSYDDETGTFSIVDEYTGETVFSEVFRDTTYTFSFTDGVLTVHNNITSDDQTFNFDARYYTEDEIQALILDKIPSQASAQNQLADKEFVNSSIATATATFRGTVTSTADLANLTGDDNDYAYVQNIDSTTGQTTSYDRYKWVESGGDYGHWKYEYTLNNSSFTAAQWDAINSGITCTIVENLLDGCYTGSGSKLAKNTSNAWNSILATNCDCSDPIWADCIYYNTNIQVNRCTGLLKANAYCIDGKGYAKYAASGLTASSIGLTAGCCYPLTCILTQIMCCYGYMSGSYSFVFSNACNPIVCEDGSYAYSYLFAKEDAFNPVANNWTATRWRVSTTDGRFFNATARSTTNAGIADWTVCETWAKNSTCFNGCTYAQACTDIRNGLCSHDCLVKHIASSSNNDRNLLLTVNGITDGAVCEVVYSNGIPLTYNASCGYLKVGCYSTACPGLLLNGKNGEITLNGADGNNTFLCAMKCRDTCHYCSLFFGIGSGNVNRGIAHYKANADCTSSSFEWLQYWSATGCNEIHACPICAKCGYWGELKGDNRAVYSCTLTYPNNITRYALLCFDETYCGTIEANNLYAEILNHNTIYDLWINTNTAYRFTWKNRPGYNPTDACYGNVGFSLTSSCNCVWLSYKSYRTPTVISNRKITVLCDTTTAPSGVTFTSATNANQYINVYCGTTCKCTLQGQSSLCLGSWAFGSDGSNMIAGYYMTCPMCVAVTPSSAGHICFIHIGRIQPDTATSGSKNNEVDITINAVGSGMVSNAAISILNTNSQCPLVTVRRGGSYNGCGLSTIYITKTGTAWNCYLDIYAAVQAYSTCQYTVQLFRNRIPSSWSTCMTKCASVGGTVVTCSRRLDDSFNLLGNLVVGTGELCTSTGAGCAHSQLGCGSLELSHSTPYIDFHRNYYCGDYSARIINNGNQLTFVVNNGTGCTGCTAQCAFAICSSGDMYIPRTICGINYNIIGCKLSKSSNSGYPTYQLLYEITSWWNATCAACAVGTTGINGTFYSMRASGWVTGDAVQVKAFASYYRSGTYYCQNGLQLSYNNLECSTSGVVPYILKNTTNNKYYLAVKLIGRDRCITFTGMAKKIDGGTGFGLSCEICTTDASGTLPSGWSIEIEGRNEKPGVTWKQTSGYAQATLNGCNAATLKITNLNCASIGATHQKIFVPVYLTGVTEPLNIWIEYMKGYGKDFLQACYSGSNTNCIIPMRLNSDHNGNLYIDFAICCKTQNVATAYVYGSSNMPFGSTGNSDISNVNYGLTWYPGLGCVSCVWNTSITFNVDACDAQFISGTISSNTISALCVATTSDVRKKKDILPYNCGLCDISNLDIISFRYKNEEENALKHVSIPANWTNKLISGEKQDSFRINDTVGILLSAVKDLSKSMTLGQKIKLWFYKKFIEPKKNKELLQKVHIYN